MMEHLAAEQHLEKLKADREEEEREECPFKPQVRATAGAALGSAYARPWTASAAVGAAPASSTPLPAKDRTERFDAMERQLHETLGVPSSERGSGVEGSALWDLQNSLAAADASDEE